MRLFVLAPHYPEYALRYSVAMAEHCEVRACIDGKHFDAEFAGRALPSLASELVTFNRFRTLRDFLGLVLAIRSFRPSIIHMQEAVGLRRGMFTLLVALIFGRSAQTVLTVHDPTSHPGRDRKVGRRSALTRILVRKMAKRIVVHGRACATELARTMPSVSSKIIVSSHGLILEPEEPTSPRGGKLRILFFGRMEDYKGLDVLWRAAEKMHRAGVAFELLVAGRGPELDRLEDDLAMLPEVQIMNGFVPPLDVIKSIQWSNCVVLPYRSASQSGVLAAAFAGRRFVVASDVGGLADVIHDGRNGILVSPGEVDQLASVLTEVSANASLRARLSNGAALTAKTEMNWSRIADRIITDLSELSLPRQAGGVEDGHR
jgi:glycosyltransferase involved in cell wall biosynthesis